MCRTNKNQFGHVQNLQKSLRHVQNLQNSIRTCAELTKSNSNMCRTYKNHFDMCRTYKIRFFGHVQNLQKAIQTCAEHTRSVKILLANSDKCTRPLSSIEFNLNERVSLTRATSESAHPITPIYLLKPRFSDNSETCLLFIRKQQQIFTTCC